MLATSAVLIHKFEQLALVTSQQSYMCIKIIIVISSKFMKQTYTKSMWSVIVAAMYRVERERIEGWQKLEHH